MPPTAVGEERLREECKHIGVGAPSCLHSSLCRVPFNESGGGNFYAPKRLCRTKNVARHLWQGDVYRGRSLRSSRYARPAIDAAPTLERWGSD